MRAEYAREKKAAGLKTSISGAWGGIGTRGYVKFEVGRDIPRIMTAGKEHRGR